MGLSHIYNGSCAVRAYIALFIRQLGGTTTRFGYPNSGPRSFPTLRALLHSKFIHYLVICLLG